MLELLKRTYWWPRMKLDVENFVRGCQSCQRNKIIHQKRAIPLYPLNAPEGPWQEITVDMIGPLPQSKNNDAMLVVIDRLTKMIRIIPTSVGITSKEIAKLYKNNIWKLHGILRKIISDRGPQFASKFMGELCKCLGIQRALSTAYHPQTDGQTEWMNQEIKAFLQHYVNYKQDNWANWITEAEFQYNNKQHSTTGFSPFYLNYGCHP